MPIVAKEKRNQLIRDGFCIFENVLTLKMVAKLNAMSDWIIAQQDEDHFEQHRSQGCIIPYWTCPHPTFTKLLVDPSAMAVFAKLGFDSPKFWSGFVISKPPHSPPLYWHQDGVLWEHPISYTNQPQQYFLMYYLVDTNIQNGCLRLIPGSHLKRHTLHDIRPRDNDSVTRATDMEHLAFQPVKGEVNVPVYAGDVVVGDSRLLHSAHANQTDQHRTVLTIWYWPAYDDLPDEVKALILDHITGRSDWADWVEQTRHITAPFLPTYEGAAEPVPWGTFPGAALM